MLFKKVRHYSVSRLLTTSIGSLLMIILLNQQANAAKLTVNISDVSLGKGHVMVAVYAGEEAYQSGQPIRATKIKANNENESVIFSALGEGEYVIQMYQDENDNGKLDMNMMGIPKEGYRFSNNVGRFGKPNYQEAKFVIKNNTVIDLNLF